MNFLKGLITLGLIACLYTGKPLVIALALIAWHAAYNAIERDDYRDRLNNDKD